MKKSLIPIALLTLAGICSCHRNPEVIPEKKLVNLLADMEIAEAYSRQPGSQFPRDSIGLSVLRHYGVSPQQLDSTLGWYGRNMDDYARLYAKIDERLEARLREISNLNERVNSEGQRDIWNHSRFLMISPQQIGDGYVFSQLQPELAPGERVEWKMRVQGNAGIEMLLGVEYDDGESKYSTQNISSGLRKGLMIQTDTARTVRRLFGSLYLKGGPQSDMRLLIDSIALVVTPIDSNEYYRERHLKKFILRNPVPSPADTVPVQHPDSVAKSREEMKDTVGSASKPRAAKPGMPGLPEDVLPAPKNHR